MPPVIRAKDLEKRFGDLVAVDRITFEVREGEVFGFLGPNGAGKTTTMKMIQCVSPKSGGTLEVFGLDVSTHERDIKKMLGVLPQETNLDPDFTVYENLMVYSRYYDIPRPKAEEITVNLLDFMQLTEKRNTSIEQLSGGMKRRLLLARALINTPPLLMLDEPTVGLDPQARHLIWEKLKSLQAQGNTIVLTTHYLEEASRLCDRIVIMDRGKILVEGNPQDLVRDQIGTEIVEAENTPPVVECLKGMAATYEIWDNRVHVYTDKPKEITSALLDSCKVRSLTARSATLEDVFLKLTGRTLRE
ncbi:MAG: ATP-binding cassette domain-containing protein [Methanomicrobiales archaeon]|nr:ATP-binding cassette domain-containing protein [Methanomicrobiales archaeon]